VCTAGDVVLANEQLDAWRIELSSAAIETRVEQRSANIQAAKERYEEDVKSGKVAAGRERERAAIAAASLKKQQHDK
jgi:hypothetical protein